MLEEIAGVLTVLLLALGMLLIFGTSIVGLIYAIINASTFGEAMFYPVAAGAGMLAVGSVLYCMLDS